jgi:hypothetical protein
MWNKSSGVKTFNQRDCQPSYTYLQQVSGQNLTHKVFSSTLPNNTCTHLSKKKKLKHGLLINIINNTLCIYNIRCGDQNWHCVLPVIAS